MKLAQNLLGLFARSAIGAALGVAIFSFMGDAIFAFVSHTPIAFNFHDMLMSMLACGGTFGIVSTVVHFFRPPTLGSSMTIAVVGVGFFVLAVVNGSGIYWTKPALELLLVLTALLAAMLGAGGYLGLRYIPWGNRA